MSDDLVLTPGGYRSRARVHHIERDHYLDQKRGTRQKNSSLRSTGVILWAYLQRSTLSPGTEPATSTARTPLLSAAAKP